MLQCERFRVLNHVKVITALQNIGSHLTTKFIQTGRHRLLIIRTHLRTAIPVGTNEVALARLDRQSSTAWRRSNNGGATGAVHGQAFARL